MSAFENATRFFHACEGWEGWNGCEPYVAPGASFEAQAGPLAEIDTVKGYTEWMAGAASWMPDGRYDLRAASWDEANRAAMFFATYHGSHSGEGGPLPPTFKEMSSDYVYVLFMDADDLVERMVKIWNAAWAMEQLGWV